MIIIAIRTDKPEAELYLYENDEQCGSIVWEAHRQLANTIHIQLEKLLKDNHKNWHDIGGLVVFSGPGSFTGLRIGITVANTLAYSLKVPIIGSTNDQWLNDGISLLLNGESSSIVVPEYGADVHITLAKK